MSNKKVTVHLMGREIRYLFKHFNWFCISRNPVHSLSKLTV